MEQKKKWQPQTGVRLDEKRLRQLNLLASKRLAEGSRIGQVKLADFVREGLDMVFEKEGIVAA